MIFLNKYSKINTLEQYLLFARKASGKKLFGSDPYGIYLFKFHLNFIECYFLRRVIKIRNIARKRSVFY